MYEVYVVNVIILKISLKKRYLLTLNLKANFTNSPTFKFFISFVLVCYSLIIFIGRVTRCGFDHFDKIGREDSNTTSKFTCNLKKKWKTSGKDFKKFMTAGTLSKESLS